MNPVRIRDLCVPVFMLRWADKCLALHFQNDELNDGVTLLKGKLSFNEYEKGDVAL